MIIYLDKKKIKKNTQSVPVVCPVVHINRIPTYFRIRQFIGIYAGIVKRNFVQIINCYIFQITTEIIYLPIKDKIKDTNIER